MQTTALIIFTITYIGIIFTRLPKMNIDRPSAAFFGAVSMVLFGVISFEEAVYAIDYNTISLLLGMMIIISTLELDGFFGWIAAKTLRFAYAPIRLLVLLTWTTGIASAFLVNDAVVLLFTPVIIGICKSLKINPIPYLIAEILSSNVGSVMTITGNPQNMLIGINSGISYGDFLLYLFPVSIIGMVIIVYCVKWFYPSEFKLNRQFDRELILSEILKSTKDINYGSMRNSIVVFLLVIVMFFLSKPLQLSIPMIALTGASLILIFGKIKPSVIIRKVDWVLLLFFASLFVVVFGIEKVGLLQNILQKVTLEANATGVAAIHGISLIGSQIVSNVPFTIVMLPLMKVANTDLLWLALASASTLAGNATIIGAMANLIVIESAETRGVKIRFLEFFRIGIAVTIVSLIFSIAVIYLHILLR